MKFISNMYNSFSGLHQHGISTTGTGPENIQTFIKTLFINLIPQNVLNVLYPCHHELNIRIKK